MTSGNSGAERIIGYAAREITGRHSSHFYTAEDIRVSLQFLRAHDAEVHDAQLSIKGD